MNILKFKIKKVRMNLTLTTWSEIHKIRHSVINTSVLTVPDEDTIPLLKGQIACSFAASDS